MTLITHSLSNEKMLAQQCMTCFRVYNYNRKLVPKTHLVRVPIPFQQPSTHTHTHTSLYLSLQFECVGAERAPWMGELPASSSEWRHRTADQQPERETRKGTRCWLKASREKERVMRRWEAATIRANGEWPFQTIFYVQHTCELGFGRFVRCARTCGKTRKDCGDDDFRSQE